MEVGSVLPGIGNVGLDNGKVLFNGVDKSHFKRVSTFIAVNNIKKNYQL